MNNRLNSLDSLPAKNPADSYALAAEGIMRETLAAYFLSVSPPEKQTPAECAQYKRALRKMAEIEINAALQSASIRRPLRYGDLTALLTATLEASARRLHEDNILLEYDLPEKSVCTAVEPRLLQMAVISLLRAAGTANPESTLSARVQIQPHSVSLAIAGNRPFGNPRVLSLARTVARAHKGGAAIAGGTLAFSLHRELPGAIGLFAAPSVEELLSNPLSPVNVGLA